MKVRLRDQLWIEKILVIMKRWFENGINKINIIFFKLMKIIFYDLLSKKKKKILT